MAVQAVEEKTMMTSSQAREKYKCFYIGFVRTEPNLSDPDNERGYVIYFADTKKELRGMPRKTEDGHSISIEPGYALGGVEVGGLYYGE